MSLVQRNTDKQARPLRHQDRHTPALFTISASRRVQPAPFDMTTLVPTTGLCQLQFDIVSYSTSSSLTGAISHVARMLSCT